MTYEERKSILREVEALRGRTLVCFFNFDRLAVPALPGLSMQFHQDAKESLFRVLKESSPQRGIDLCLYTRGGDTNSVWPLVSLLREFDPEFQVLAPFRCHSSGTLMALGASRILMGPLSELSPIDPSTGNQFNPVDPLDPRSRMVISVEDVRAYRAFVGEQLGKDCVPGDIAPFLHRLATEVHPLALGNVQRVLMQIEQLASRLLELHPREGENVGKIVESLTSRFYSHLHMIDRHEARSILGERVELASPELSAVLDRLLRAYEDSFDLRRPFFLKRFLDGKPVAEVRFIGGVVESAAWSYLYETKAAIRQISRVPPNVQIQIPFGQPMPLVPGLPTELEVEVSAQGWMHNQDPLGVTT